MNPEADVQVKLENWLRKEYGVLVDSTTTARILGFRNTNTFTKARDRGTVGIDMFRVPNRQGLFTSPRHLAAYLRATIPFHHLPHHCGGCYEATDMS